MVWAEDESRVRREGFGHKPSPCAMTTRFLEAASATMATVAGNRTLTMVPTGERLCIRHSPPRRAAVRLDQKKPQAKMLPWIGARGIGPVERLEDVLEMLGGNPRAVIYYGQFPASFFPGHRQLYIDAGTVVFDRIRKEIHHDAAKPVRLSRHSNALRHHMTGETQAPCHGQGLDHVGTFIAEFRNVDGFIAPARFRQLTSDVFQQGMDETAEEVRLGQAGAEAFGQLGRGAGTAKGHLKGGHQRRNGRAKLVGCVCKKLPPQGKSLFDAGEQSVQRCRHSLKFRRQFPLRDPAMQAVFVDGPDDLGRAAQRAQGGLRNRISRRGRHDPRDQGEAAQPPG